jgi:Ca-activated chloride channel homolog
MKISTLVVAACAAMFASSALVCALVPLRSSRTPDELRAEQGARPVARASGFQGGRALAVDVRLGHAELPRAGAREDLLLVDLEAPQAVSAARGTTSTALVIDRSGSMAGARLAQAVAAARQWVLRLADGDEVTVATFDDGARLAVPLTRIDAATRPRVLAALDGITAGGNTCISCGVELAAQALRGGAGQRRMIVLSDGKATAGMRTLDDARSMAVAARADEVAIVTLGIGEAYAEDLLALLAFETNGSHHFIEDAMSIEPIFAAEAEKLAATVARAGEVTIALADGVELVRVFDRAHRVAGNEVIVPLGSFTGGQHKTVLAEVRVRGDGAALRPVARVTVRFEDGGGALEVVEGQLDVALGARASALDPRVALRLAGKETAHGLERAAALFEAGRREEALALLDEQRAGLAAAASATPELAATAAAALATASAARADLATAPTTAARREVLRNKARAISALE